MLNNYSGIKKRIVAFTHTYDNLSAILRIPIFIAPPNITITDISSIGISANAIWDTGASQTTISQEVADKLKLPIVSMKQVNTAGGMYNATVHRVSIAFPMGVYCNNVLVTACKLTSPIEALIGMDIIASGDFAISNTDNKTTVSFRLPSLVKTDYIQWLKNQDSSIKQSEKTGRNDLCPCGSNKKYKNCCGKNT